MYIDWKSRLKNYGFWMSLSSYVVLMLIQFGAPVDENWVMNTMKIVLAILGLLGLVNNPTTANTGFSDDKEVAPDGTQETADNSKNAN